MRASGSISDRLFHQDCRIAINTVRATFAGWHDRLIAAVMLLAALATVRSWFADWPWTIAVWAVLGAGIILGGGAQRLVAARLAFHGFDGVLAADALHPPTRRRYVAAWHGLGLALLTAITLIARPSLLLVGAAGYLVGALAAGLMGGFRMRGAVAGNRRPGWLVRAWLHRPGAGAAAGMILLLSLLPARALGTNALMAVVGIETVLLAVALTVVDDGIVRFMTIAGHGSRRIVAYHGRSMASFGAVTVPGCWLALGAVAAGIVTAASIAMLLLLILRVLAYRLHGKRFADLLVALFAGLLMLVAYSLPVALPVVAIAIPWQLQRSGRARTWLLA